MRASIRKERKVVTVLFADLVGFTARAETLDPEDVEAILEPYHERLRAELERFGGTVEKFIGDAVMAVFGAPVAHEDDPERAVRAAIAIRDWAQEDKDLQVRIGITTGEALVKLSAHPEQGEGMASGDVVNTAARLQGAASEDSILVDETSYRATRDRIDYREHAPVEAKGKAEPIRVWEAIEPRARLGVDVVRDVRTPLFGRGREVELVTGTLDRVLAEREPQLVTLVGVPGIGKSRLVYELMRHIESGGELVSWRQGRSLPYGEGVSFWALAEIVKAQAGILESDSDSEVAAKLARAVRDVVEPEPDAAWVESHLGRLVGLTGIDELAGDRRDEAFAAWRRFLEALAEHRPLVLVFEDLHWADEGLLDFVDELVDWTSGVPLLAVCTARPELLDRRPGWGGGKLNTSTLGLSPLADDDTARVIAGVLERSVLPAETQAALVERAGGNPLYAEQFAHLYRERGSAEQLPVPETLQGVIAARLDGLPAEEKQLLQDAAVLGKVFWVGALRRSASDVARALHALERKGFVRRERRSVVEGEQQYAFLHLLVRDVAYTQIPRGDRAEKHRFAAAWIESLGRPDDHAEMLAHHYVSALELARAAGRPTDDLTERARAALREAGERAVALNAFAAAARSYEHALALMPSDDAERRELLFALGHALHVAGSESAGHVLEEATQALLDAGDHVRAAEAYALLAELWWQRGQRDRSLTYQERAVELVGETSPSPAKARVLAEASRFAAISGRPEAALGTGREALAIAEADGLTELAARALNNIGVARYALGDPDGVHDLERSVELALSVNSPEAVRGYNNLAALAFLAGDARRQTDLSEEALRVAERIGLASAVVRHVRGNLVGNYWGLGEWDEALRRADDFIAEVEAGAPHYMETGARRWRARIRMARDEPSERVLEDLERALELSRAAKDPQALLPTLAVAARTFVELGRHEEGRELAAELVRTLENARRGVLAFAIEFLVVARELGYAEKLVEAVRRDREAGAIWRQTAEALLEGEYARAADLLDETGYASWAADARLRAARTLARDRRRAEADVQLRKALAFWRSVGATRYIREGESLLAATA